MVARLVSPNELHNAAKAAMTEGREPSTRTEWLRIANFWAANLDPAATKAATILIARIFDCPLTDDELRQVAQFQVERLKQKPRTKGKH